MDPQQNAGVTYKETRTFPPLFARDKRDCTILPGKMDDEMSFNTFNPLGRLVL